MEFAFYSCGFFSILATLCAITDKNPVHALLYLIVSFLAISGVFFSVGAYFSGALEIIIYAGAIMVLFIFVIMLLNLESLEIDRKHKNFKFQEYIYPSILSSMMLFIIIYAIIIDLDNQNIDGKLISAKEVGISLFGPYILIVEIASTLLLSGLIVAFHFSHKDRIRKVLNNLNLNGTSSRKME